jgi:methylated-DNA-protein-cysteine methyltransferase related protein
MRDKESIKPVATFSIKAKALIKKIPNGRVATYGQIAALAGNPQGARQVAWLLNSSSRKDNLPWFRVINRRGGISLLPGHGFETQKKLLARESVIVGKDGVVDLDRYQWIPRRPLKPKTAKSAK